MKLKSFGCSFTFGTDLDDANDGATQLLIQPSNKTWPALLSQHLGYEYECFAWAGLGNLQILERVLGQLSGPPALFVINWSWIDRFDYNPNYNSTDNITEWNTIMPVDKTDVANTYYKHLHSEYRDKFTCLTYIKLAIDTLDQCGIPYLMTYQDELLFDTRWHISPAVTYLQNYVKPRMTMFDGQTFLDWSRSNGYPESDTWHPLESAHLAGFELLKSNLGAILHKV